MHVCNLAYLSVHICLPTALHDFTASKPSKQHNNTSFSTLLSDTGDKVQSIHQLLGYVHDSSGYKCLRPGGKPSFFKGFCKMSSCATAATVQGCLQVSLGQFVFGVTCCGVTWALSGPLLTHGLPCKILGEQTVWTTNAVPGLGFNECYVWSIEKHYIICCWDFKIAWGLS